MHACKWLHEPFLRIRAARMNSIIVKVAQNKKKRRFKFQSSERIYRFISRTWIQKQRCLFYRRTCFIRADFHAKNKNQNGKYVKHFFFLSFYYSYLQQQQQNVVEVIKCCLALLSHFKVNTWRDRSLCEYWICTNKNNNSIITKFDLSKEWEKKQWSNRSLTFRWSTFLKEHTHTEKAKTFFPELITQKNKSIKFQYFSFYWRNRKSECEIFVFVFLVRKKEIEKIQFFSKKGILL